MKNKIKDLEKKEKKFELHKNKTQEILDFFSHLDF